MTSKWMIETSYIDGKRMHRAFRERDVDAPGDREYKGNYSQRLECVQALVDALNAGEAIP